MGAAGRLATRGGKRKSRGGDDSRARLLLAGRLWILGAENGLASHRPGLGGAWSCYVTLLASVIDKTGMEMTSALWGPEVRARRVCGGPTWPRLVSAQKRLPRVPQAWVAGCFPVMEVGGPRLGVGSMEDRGACKRRTEMMTRRPSAPFCLSAAARTAVLLCVKIVCSRPGGTDFSNVSNGFPINLTGGNHPQMSFKWKRRDVLILWANR